MKQAPSLLSIIVILLTMLILHTTNASAKLYMGKITMQVGETRSVEAVPPTSAYTASGSFSKTGTCVAITANGSYTCKIKANYVGTGTLSYWGSVARSNTWTTDIYDLYWDVEVKSSGGGSSTESGILVNQVGIYPSSLTMEVGDEKNLIELITPINATNQKVNWSSENPKVASISSDGHVIANSMGTTNIICKATDGSGKQAICPVEVRAKNGEFKANNANGIEIKFHIVSEENKTCAVGGWWSGYRAIAQETTGTLVIPSSVEGYTVTEIGERAFSNCASITFVELPSTIIVIGYGAFQNCASITSVELPPSVKKIKSSAFYGCTSLTQITGISGIEYIENSVFSQTPWYDALPDGHVYIGKTYYGYKGEMPENTTIKIKEGTKSIAHSAFKKSAGSDGYFGHGNNKNLIAVEIPASVVQIGRENMELDTERLIFNCPDIVGDYPNPFDCPHLQSIVIDSGNKYYESPENCNAIIEKRTGMVIAACNNTVIPSSVKIIAPLAFGLNGMDKIKSLVIPDNVEIFGGIDWCENLENLIIGKNVNRIGKCFGNPRLMSVYSLSEAPSAINDDVFDTNTYENGTLFVPIGSKINYKGTIGWSKFKNIAEFDPATEPWASTKGDVNGDEQVNGTDLVAFTNIILDKSSKTDAADVNGDGYVNSTDYVALANIVLGRSNAKAMAKGAIQATATTGLAIESLDIKAGESKEMVIDLTNPDDDITLVQFDLRLPTGLSVQKTSGEYDYDIAGRTTWRKHSLDANATNGIVRFLLASNSNATLTGTEDAIVTITVQADNSFTGGDIQLENILLVTPEEKEIKPSDVSYTIGTTGIKSIISDSRQKDAAIYNLSGQRLYKPRKGLNIIGGKKVMVK